MCRNGLSLLQTKLNGFHVDVLSFLTNSVPNRLILLLHAVCNTAKDGGQATGYNEEGSH
jgi:hypothetical protein